MGPVTSPLRTSASSSVTWGCYGDSVITSLIVHFVVRFAFTAGPEAATEEGRWALGHLFGSDLREAHVKKWMKREGREGSL